MDPIKTYTTNAQYRQCLRELFKMNPEICEAKVANTEKHNQESIDDETADEMRYDNDAVGKIMDHVYEKTKNHPLFQELYEKAAAKMMSLDPEIGLCILFSYDYLLLFRNCLDVFFKSQPAFNEETTEFIALRQKL
jgi:hypothetical protein